MSNCATPYDFIEAQILQYGFEYVENLAENGYHPYMTNRGWKWMKVTSAERDAMFNANDALYTVS